MFSPPGRARHVRSAKSYRGSRYRIRQIERHKKTPIGVWILLLTTLLLLAVFFYFNRLVWPITDSHATTIK